MKEKRNFLFSTIALSTLMFPACTPARPVDQDPNGFVYREVFLPQGMGANAESLGLNSIDVDWGIWGHNLGEVLPEKHSESVYAKENDATLKSQYCFSSARLYDYITQYIDDNYSSSDHTRFSIIPNDNDIVCLCIKCKEAGNTAGNASPAVTNLVRKLAARYPNHKFYMSDYRTTQALPEDSLPSNAGVMVSAMSYPMTLKHTPEQDAFMEKLDKWGSKTNNILVWDYINNFDDYFTPYPNLGIMQDRLQNYKKHNVTAMFLNGSGSDASSMSNLKTIVLAELLKNPNADWQTILSEKAVALYPVTGKTIADFMLNQENFVKGNQAVLPLYEGVRAAKNTYLPEDLFVNFHNTLLKQREKTTGEERKYLDKLLPKLAFTRLELNRINGDFNDSELLLDELSKLKSMKVDAYNESGWFVESYLKDYRFMLDHAWETSSSNLLKGEKLKALTPLDPDYSDLSIVTDGLLGLPSNYHAGHLINTPEKETSIQIPHKPGATKLKVWLSYLPGYKVYLPAKVRLSGAGAEIKEVNVSYPKEYTGHYPVEFDLPANNNGPMTLTLVKDPEKRSMSIEEIEMY